MSKSPAFVAKNSTYTVKAGKSVNIPQTLAEGNNTEAPRKRARAIEQVHVSEAEWQTFVEFHGGYEGHAARLKTVLEHAQATAEDTRVAIVLMAVRLYVTDPSQFQHKNGNFNASKLARALDVYNTGPFRTAISKGVPAILASGVSFYGRETPELRKLALSSRDAELQARAKSQAKKQSESAGDATKAETVSDDTTVAIPRTAQLAELLQRALELAGELTAEDRDSEGFPAVGALVDTLSDVVHA